MRTVVLSFAIAASVSIYGQSGTFQRGELVRVLPTATRFEPQSPALAPAAQEHRAGMVLRVVALAHDRIRIEKDAIYVNDVRVTGFSPDFVARVVRAPERVPDIVPEGHYFVMGEKRINEDISEYSGQHFGDSLERASR
jgi:hypothetical protein